jgi:hypothetical protein
MVTTLPEPIHAKGLQRRPIVIKMAGSLSDEGRGRPANSSRGADNLDPSLQDPILQSKSEIIHLDERSADVTRLPGPNVHTQDGKYNNFPQATSSSGQRKPAQIVDTDGADADTQILDFHRSALQAFGAMYHAKWRQIGGVGASSEGTLHDSGIGTSISQQDLRKLNSTTEIFPRHIPVVEEMDDTVERATTYSEATIDSTAHKKQNYKRNLAAMLCRDLSLRSIDNSNIARVSASLPRILQIFAFKIAKEGNDKDFEDVMRFILKHRK